jgi:hypothetical protein
VQVFDGVVHEGALLPTLLCTGAPEAIEAAGAAISKGHLLLSHHFSWRQYLLKLYCMDTRLLVAIVGRQTPTLILNNFICCTMLRAQKKIRKRTYIARCKGHFRRYRDSLFSKIFRSARERHKIV